MGKDIKKNKLKWLIMLILCVLLMAAESYFDLKIPDIMTEITAYIQNDSNDMKEIILSGMKMLLYTSGSIAALIAASVIVAKAAADLSAIIRRKLFRKTQEFSFSEINKFSVPSLITRATNDVVNIETTIVTGALVLIKAPIIVLMTLKRINGKNTEWSLITAAATFLIILICTVALVIAYRKFVSLQQLTDEVNLVSHENLKGIYTVRAYNFETQRFDKFVSKNRNLAMTERFTNITISVVNTLITFILNSLPVVIYLVGAYIIEGAGIEKRILVFSDRVVYSTYALQIINAILMVIVVFIMLPRAMVSVKRIHEVISETVSIKNGTEPAETNIESIEYKAVDFRYPDARKDVVSDISFSISKGETFAVTGSTGCGKTTLVSLLMRFYDVTGGEILINGRNIREFTLNGLRSMIGYVPQKSFLFGGTVDSNIAYGSNDTDEQQLMKACYTSCTDEFIDTLPEKSNSNVSRGGENFSGGQRQRMAIARALYKAPPILIFDDSFSALDYKTDSTVRKRLQAMYKDSIKIIISQRISTILDADKIMVLENGEISGIGTHDELIRTCDYYREFASVQMTGGGSVD